jgi:predicted transcriptional regulator YheO
MSSKSEWQQRVTSFLNEAARERNWDLEALSKEQRRELLWDLKQRGGFREGQAKALVGKLMGISKAAVESELG